MIFRGNALNRSVYCLIKTAITEMERDCFAAGTSVSLANGLSVKIENMGKREHEVLGWDNKLNGVVPAKQVNFLHKGKRECVELTYEDGRTQICTKNHRLLTSENKWIHADDLKVGKNRLKTCVDYPTIDIDEEIKDCGGWKLNVGSIKLSTDTHNGYMKALAFSRIIGMILTDGTLSKTNTGQIRGYVYLGHMIDVQLFTNDLKLFCDVSEPKMYKNNYHVYIPKDFVCNIIKLEGIIPSFILDNECPKPIIREFLGGMFGGDGHTCVFDIHRGKKDILTSISFSRMGSSIHSIRMLEQIKMLFGRFGIDDITLQKPKETQNLHLKMKELIPFSEKIGFRYCCHKSQRLAAGVSYRKFLEVNSEKVPIAEEYFEQIGAIGWFNREYGVSRDRTSLPTMNLKLISKKYVGLKDVYDIQVNKVESFLANGIVSHNCMIAHGMGQFLKERMTETSDLYSTYVCDKCGFIAQQMLGSPGVYHCPQCENSTDISKINMTYAFKLLVQELMSMNIAPRIRVKKDIYDDLV